MGEGVLRAALVGAGSFGAHALKALRNSSRVELVGLSDQDRRAAEAASVEAGCPAYSDHRRLLVETAPEAAFLAVPPAPAAELVRLGAKRNVHLWRQVPLARNLPEAVELCRLTARTGRKFAVGTPRRFMPGYQHARTAWARLGRVFCLQGHYQFNYGAGLGWRGDRAAGGGALIELGYHLFDLLVWLLGLPRTVYAITATGQRTGGADGQPVYDSDDSAVAVLRYPGDVVATVAVSRCFNPVSEQLTAYGQAGTLSAGPGGCTLRDRDGNVLESLESDEPPADVFARMIDAFVRPAAEAAPRYDCSGWENLLTMAVVAAAYLSNQTGEPESPGRLLANYDVAPADCLRFAPPGKPPHETK